MTPPQCPDFILAETTDGLILSYRGEEFTVDDDMRKDLIAYLEIQSRRDKVLDILDEWLNSDDHLSLYKWEVREKIRELRQAGSP